MKHITHKHFNIQHFHSTKHETGNHKHFTIVRSQHNKQTRQTHTQRNETYNTQTLIYNTLTSPQHETCNHKHFTIYIVRSQHDKQDRHEKMKHITHRDFNIKYFYIYHHNMKHVTTNTSLYISTFTPRQTNKTNTRRNITPHFTITTPFNAQRSRNKSLQQSK